MPTRTMTHEQMTTFISSQETDYVEHLTPEMKLANCRHWVETLISLADGGICTWKDTGYTYTKKNRKFYADSPSAYAMMWRNTNDKFMENFVVYEHNFKL